MKLSIRWFVTALFMIVTLVLGLSITALSFNRMKAASLESGDQLIEVTGAAINDSFARFRLEVSGVLATTTGHGLARAQTFSERAIARSDLFSLLDANPLVIGAFVGYPDGDAFTLRRVRSTDAIPPYWRTHGTYLIVSDRTVPGVGERYWLYDGYHQLLTNGDMPRTNYDPRTRPWYQAQTNHVLFSAPFVSGVTNALVFSLSQRSRSGSVVGINVSLEGYSDLLRQLRPTRSALGAIIRTPGNVALAFTDVPAFLETIRRNGNRPVTLADLQSPPLLAALALARSPTARSAGIYRDADGRTWLCSFTPSLDANGKPLRRAVLLAVPENELLSAALAQRNAELLLCLGIVFCMIPVAYLLSKILAEPIDVLRDDAATLRNLDFTPQPSRRSVITEFDEFSETFGTMREHIKQHNDAVARFIPRHFLDTLGHRDITDLQLGEYHEGVMTLLFADIRAFTTLSGGMSPEDTFRFINSYLSKIGPIVREHGGFIDKYIGDAIMAIFPGQPSDAVDAAIAMQRRLALYNEERARKEHQPIAVGIGIHRGALMLGTIGEEERFETTVISDAVIVATQLEALTKTFGSPILASEEVVATLEPSKYIVRDLGETMLADGRHTITVYEVSFTSASVV